MIESIGLNLIKQIDYTIDLTKQYHNLLQQTERELGGTYEIGYRPIDNEQARRTRFVYDFGVLTGQNEDEIYHYYHDDLGSPMRLINEHGHIRDTFEYDEFGNSLYKTYMEQPFGFTGYGADELDMTGTLFAQARQYMPDVGRFVSEDTHKGFQSHPFTLNAYNYVWNSPLNLVDLDGLWPSWNDITNGFNNFVDGVGNVINNVVDTANDAWNSTTQAVSGWWNDLPDWAQTTIQIGGVIGVGAAVVLTGGALAPVIGIKVTTGTLAGAYTVGVGINAGGQMIFDNNVNSIHDINWVNAAVSGTGAVTSLLIPGSTHPNGNVLTSMFGNALNNMSVYALTQFLNGKSIDPRSLGINGGLGLAFGGLTDLVIDPFFNGLFRTPNATFGSNILRTFGVPHSLIRELLRQGSSTGVSEILSSLIEQWLGSSHEFEDICPIQ